MASFEGMRRAPEVAPTVEKRHRKELQGVDIFVLEEGLKKLQRFFLSCPAEEFPQTLIFPDTSARPLAYAVKALVEDACHRRALPVPALRFFQAKRMGLTYHDPNAGHEATLALKKISQLDVSPSGWKDLGSRLKEIRNEFTQGRRSRREHDEEIVAQRSMRSRAEMIVGETGSDFLMVVDDYMVDGGTLKGIREAFAPLLSSKPHAFRSFVFCAYDRRDSARDLDTPDQIFGVTTRDVSGSGYSTGPMHFTGFSYREDDPARTVGVVKDFSGTNVKKSPTANHDRMRGLRQEMVDVAERVIQKDALRKGKPN